MKVAFVTPWYGKNIPGGAESECRKTALNLKKAGVNVEILTTCVKDFHSDWSENYHEEKVYEIEGVKVSRFKVRKRDIRSFDAVNAKLMNFNNNILKDFRFKSPVSSKEEKIFIEEMINSPNLYDHISKCVADYDFFVFIPYMFGTTYYGSQICPEKSILIPCLHDESYAYMNIYRDMFVKARALLFNAASELNFAKERYGIKDERAHLIGIGVDSDFSFDGSRFREKYGIEDQFILYAGRKDSTKNVPLLIEYFFRYLKRNPQKLKLILIGPGDTEIFSDHKENIIDLGFIPLQDKYDACDAALVLCQPSLNESFSLVLMEAWLTSTPVLVHSNCSVTRDHCLSSGGGLFFSDYDQFEKNLDFVISNPHITERMGKSGKEYVLDNFSWKSITQKYIDLFINLKNSPRAKTKPVINIMTASLTKGDAIGNYINSLKEILEAVDFPVRIFADQGSIDLEFLRSTEFRSSENDILWFHYSIYSDNLKYIKEIKGFKVMDFHGVTPPDLFKGHNRELEVLTRKGQASLNKYTDDFDLCIVHSDYTYDVLKKVGYRNIIKSPLMVTDDLSGTEEDRIFSDILEKLEYIVFVGRIVPQKDIPSIVRLFGELKKRHPDIVLFLVGPKDIAPGYVREVAELTASLGLEKSICLTGKIVDSSVLAAFYKYAKFSIILSEWETFCVPIVESMYFGVPVIGINKTCVPETLGDAGIVLDALDFKRNAEIISKVWNDDQKYRELCEKARLRAKSFGQNELKKRILEIVEDYFPKSGGQ